MFIYNLKFTDTLLAIAKNRDYVQNNPNLCYLLENPLLKDDTELAIRYNEYKQGYPDAGKSFVDYYYIHGPELDTATLIEWNNKISEDPTLREIAIQNDADITSIQQHKKETKDISWLSDIIDCLSNPCQYMSLISDMVGAALSETTSRYGLKNQYIASRGNLEANSDQLVTAGLPSYIRNKMPECILRGCDQLCGMIADNTKDVGELIKNSKHVTKEDPFILANAELLGAEVLSDLASSLGDCFRILEYKRRYNPYNYDQNQAKGNYHGKVVYDTNGNPRTVTPTGSPMNSTSAMAMSDNIRLSPEGNTKAITLSTLNLETISSDGYIPFLLTCYNGFITPDYEYYGDQTGYSYKGKVDHLSNAGKTCTYKYGILPNRIDILNKTRIITADGAAEEAVKDSIKGNQLALTKIYIDNRWMNFSPGVGTKEEHIIVYFKKLFAKKYPELLSSPDLSGLISHLEGGREYRSKSSGERKAARQKGIPITMIADMINNCDLRVILKYPAKTVEIPVIDTGGGGDPAKIALKNQMPWCDVTAFMYTLEGYNNIATLKDTKTGKILNTTPGLPWPMYDMRGLSPEKMDGQVYLEKAVYKGIIGRGGASVVINGVNYTEQGHHPMVPGLYYFADREGTKKTFNIQDERILEILCNPSSRYLASTPQAPTETVLDDRLSQEEIVNENNVNENGFEEAISVSDAIETGIITESIGE